LRLTGVVETLHESPYRYGGSYGTIKCEDGSVYTWDSGNVFRDRTSMLVGQRVSFDPISYSYATNISSKGHRE
jgi:hypothetical protein